MVRILLGKYHKQRALAPGDLDVMDTADTKLAPTSKFVFGIVYNNYHVINNTLYRKFQKMERITLTSVFYTAGLLLNF